MYELLIHDIGTVITTSTGVFFNLFLLFVIATDSTVATTGYKKMLAIISVYNIYFSIVHKIVEPVYLIDKYGFICLSKTFSNSGSYWSNYLSLAFYANSFAQSLSLLGVHCFFRYAMITGNFKSLFNTWYGIFSLVLFHFFLSGLYVCFCIFGMSPTNARRDISAQDVKHYLNITFDATVYYYGPVFKYPDENGVESYRWDIVASTLCLAFCGSFYMLICVTGIKLYAYVKQASMTTTMKRTQLQLLYVLCAQAVSPLFCEFLPALVVIYGGFFGIVGSSHGLYASVFISGYSPVDACLALMLFKAYRIRALELLSKPFPCLKRFSTRKSFKTSITDTKMSHPLPSVTPISAEKSTFKLRSTFQIDSFHR